jgi:hypothetical protein
MSIFNMTKQTNNNIKDVSLALVLIGALIGALTISTSVTAAPVESIEKSVSNFVVAQGAKLMTDLNIQLQQSINKEIQSMSANFSLNNSVKLLTTDKTSKQAVVNDKNKITSIEKTNSLHVKSN